MNNSPLIIMASHLLLLKSNFNINLLLQKSFNFPPNRSFSYHNSLKFNHKTISIPLSSKLENNNGKDSEKMVTESGRRSYTCSSSSSSSRNADIEAYYYYNTSSSPSSPDYAPTSCRAGDHAGLCFFFFVLGVLASVIFVPIVAEAVPEKTSVIKLQVGLLGSGRSLQTKLNQIADTSSRKDVLTETILALLRHPDYCISGYSSVDLKKTEDGEKLFNHISIEEMGKINKETLVNVNNIKRQSATSQRLDGSCNEYIVITIIVAARGVHKLPPINSSAQLKEALQKLGSIPSSKIKSVAVLSNPPNENDTLSERELLEDYSLLHPL